MDSIIANIIIIIAGITLLAAIALTVHSVWHSLRVNKRAKMENGIPTRNIAYATAALPVVVALPVLLFASIADACIITGITMILVASILVICGRIRTLKRGSKNYHP